MLYIVLQYLKDWYMLTSLFYLHLSNVYIKRFHISIFFRHNQIPCDVPIDIEDIYSYLSNSKMCVHSFLKWWSKQGSIQELSIGSNTSRIRRMSRYMFHMITCALFIAICMDGARSRKPDFFPSKSFFLLILRKNVGNNIKLSIAVWWENENGYSIAIVITNAGNSHY